MKRLLQGLFRAGLLLPIGAAFEFNGCAADLLRDAADRLDEPSDDDVDLGDLLADDLEDL